MKAVFGLGANLGDAAEALQSAVDMLCSIMSPIAVSSVYRTAPVGGPDQPDYLNAVLIGDCQLDPFALLAAASAAESARGRTREIHWGPRTLDVDVLAYGDIVRTDPQLTLPHPRAHERGFVLVPWAEIDAEFEIPGRGRVGDLVHGVEVLDIERTSIVLQLPGVVS